MLERIGGLVRLGRPLNCLMFFGGTYVGGIMVAELDAFRWPESRPLILAALSVTLIGAGANALNDAEDVSIDRLNRPKRPIPSGAVTIGQARSFGLVVSTLGILLAGSVGPTHLIIAAVAFGLLYAYSAFLKAVPVAGNVVIGLVVAASLVYGGLSVGGFAVVLPAALFAFLTSVARELVKDVEDLEGDAANQVRSLAVRAGPRLGLRVGIVLLAITIALTPIPFVALDYGGLYLLLVLATDGFLLAAAWAAMQAEGSRKLAARASGFIKTGMIVGLGALSVSGITAM